MNIDRTGWIELIYTNSGPICPNDLPPRSREHQLATDIGDDVYTAAGPVDEETGEHSELVDKLTEAAYHGRHASSRMNLYRDEVDARSTVTPGGVKVEALFFRCHVCGLVLPANRTPRTDVHL